MIYVITEITHSSNHIGVQLRGPMPHRLLFSRLVHTQYVYIVVAYFR